MTKQMLIDTSKSEMTRVVIFKDNRLEELDFELANRKQLRGNIYLATVTRIEPSLQAAFIDYGGNRHGFLPFSEIHPAYYTSAAADDHPESDVTKTTSNSSDLPSDQTTDHPHETADQTEAFDPRLDVVLSFFNHYNGHASISNFFPEPHTTPSPQPQDEDVPIDIRDSAPNDRDVTSESDAVRRHDSAFAATDYGASLQSTPLMDRDETEELLPEWQTDSSEEPEEPEENNQHDLAETAEVEVPAPQSVEEKERFTHLTSQYKIQDVLKRYQFLVVQVTKEERGNKGATLTTYLSIPGRYCVLLLNTIRGGGISRKITNPNTRKRLKEMLEDLNLPAHMSLILRTAGMERNTAEIRRDLEYLLRLRETIRAMIMTSTTPHLLYEEANLIKRSIRDLYTSDIDTILIEGETGYRTAKDFIRLLMSSHAKRVQPYRRSTVSLFNVFDVESQIEALHTPVVSLKSGGSLVITPTEALVAIDVNSGRATRERHIEETAAKTNLEAAEEIARQLRLRDLAGLIVIDFIDMKDTTNLLAVERKLKESMKPDRARHQIGKISSFGLLEMSRQRLRSSLLEYNFDLCSQCSGIGYIRTVESASLFVMRTIEKEGLVSRSRDIKLTLPTQVALYLLNYKRQGLAQIESLHDFRVEIAIDDRLVGATFRLEHLDKQPVQEQTYAPGLNESEVKNATKPGEAQKGSRKFRQKSERTAKPNPTDMNDRDSQTSTTTHKQKISEPKGQNRHVKPLQGIRDLKEEKIEALPNSLASLEDSTTLETNSDQVSVLSPQEERLNKRRRPNKRRRRSSNLTPMDLLTDDPIKSVHRRLPLHQTSRITLPVSLCAQDSVSDIFAVISQNLDYPLSMSHQDFYHGGLGRGKIPLTDFSYGHTATKERQEPYHEQTNQQFPKEQPETRDESSVYASQVTLFRFEEDTSENDIDIEPFWFESLWKEETEHSYSDLDIDPVWSVIKKDAEDSQAVRGDPLTQERHTLLPQDEDVRQTADQESSTDRTREEIKRTKEFARDLSTTSLFDASHEFLNTQIEKEPQNLEITMISYAEEPKTQPTDPPCSDKSESTEVLNQRPATPRNGWWHASANWLWRGVKRS